MKNSLIGGVDTRQSPSGKLILRTRRYMIGGQIYNLIKRYSDKTFLLTRFRNPDNLMQGVTTIFVERQAQWGAGLTWKQAEKIAEKTIAAL